MVIKIILAISLVGFLGFEIFNLVSAIKRRRRLKREQLAAAQRADDTPEDIQKFNKEDNA